MRTQSTAVAMLKTVSRQVLGSLPLLMLACITHAANGNPVTYKLDIPAQRLDDALQALALVSQSKLLYTTELVNGMSSPHLRGEYTTEQAVKELLAGTGLTYEVSDGLVLIRGSKQSLPAALEGSAEGAWGEGFRVAQAEEGETQASPPNEDVTLVEIIVTAQKREERLQDVPVPVTAISAGTLTSTNQLRLEDYYSSIPGLNLTKNCCGDIAQISIRGLSSGFTNPSVGTVVDDIPYGSSTSWGGGTQVPDFDPGDMQRVEVLRGPQGTLYGTSSLGGLLKFVTVDPSTESLSSRIQMGTSSVRKGNELGYNIRGSINVPLNDTVAIRASGYSRMEPGYIDNVISGAEDVNQSDSKGGRVSALWRASEAITLKLSALMQQTERGGGSEIVRELGFDNFQQQNLPSTGRSKKDFRAYSAALTAKLGRVGLTSLTGYNTYENSPVEDLGGTVDGVINTKWWATVSTKKWSQELRLDMPFGQRLDWQLGAFYTHEKTSFAEAFGFADLATGSVASAFGDLSSKGTHEEYAVFTNLAVELTDRFDVQLGARQAYYDQEFHQVIAGPFGDLLGGSPFMPPPIFPKDHAFTYLVTPRFRASPDLMVYARFASGYRSGGPSSNTSSLVIPPLKPDTTRNYEIGLKGSLPNRKLTFDASIYYIDWQDIQLNTVDQSLAVPFTVQVNADSAKSQGVELSLQAKPLKGLALGMWVAWNEAELTADMPSNLLAQGKRGDELPYSAPFSGQLSAEQEFAISGGLSGFAGGAVNYVDERKGHFIDGFVAVRRALPSYATTNLRAGVRGDSWEIGMFANNLFDKRGVLAISDFQILGNYPYLLIQPRTIGLNLSKGF